MHSVRSISTMRDNSLRPNSRNSGADFSISRWHMDFSGPAARGPLPPDEDEAGFGFTTCVNHSVRVMLYAGNSDRKLIAPVTPS